ncbi:MAG: tetratricopeptide repeat protein [Phycisphaerae bacterium]|nr:tetratricopeptide repeat protein [Phycisphaerae bacterium]
MSARRTVNACIATLLIATIGLVPSPAAALDQPDLHRAYYLEHAAKDFTTAKAIYDKLLDADIPAGTKQAARAGSDRCRDHLAAENFATLMPEDALLYVEIKRPGRIVEQFAEMLGLAGKNMQEILANRPNASSNMLFHIPQEIAISPAIFEELNRFGGAAVAITDFDPRSDGPPSGVLVLHHGDLAFLKGLLETAFQFAPTAEKIGGMPTFGAQVPDVGHVSGVLTESLLIVGTGDDLVEGVVNRLVGTNRASLATREDLTEITGKRGNETLFAFVDMQKALKIAKASMDEHDQRDFAVVDAFCDLDSLRWATVSAGIDDGVLGLELTIRLAADHRNFVYNLVRLPPVTRDCLRAIPPDAAAFLGLGLNPALTHAAVGAAESRRTDPTVTGFDIGREIFGNIQAICAFVVPGKMPRPKGENGPPVIPNIGVVLAVNDTAKSKALWDQLLAIPGLVAGGKPIVPNTTTIGDTDVTAFSIPDFGKIYMAELDHCIAIGATRGAIKATIEAYNKQESILDDEVMGGMIDDMPNDSSIMIAAHVGRLAKVATGADEPGVAIVAGQVAQLCPHTVAWFGLGQSPNQLTLRTAVTGLPNVNEALKTFAPMLKSLGGLASAMASSRQMDPEQTALAEVNRLANKGIEASEKGDYKAALKYALRAHEIADIGLTNFNLACVYSRLGKKDKALEHLLRAAEQGMEDTGHDVVQAMQKDSDLDNIRDDPRFEKALAIARGKSVKAKKHEKSTEPDEL